MIKLNLYVFDLDGTIIDNSAMHRYAGKEPPRSQKNAYKQWLNRAQNYPYMEKDPAIPGMVNIVQSLYNEYNTVVFLTARCNSIREKTKRWLVNNNLGHIDLYMRVEGNFDTYWKYKEDAIKEMVKKYNPNSITLIDDDPNDKLNKICLKNNWTMLKSIR